MKYIKKIVKSIKEELEDAEKYADRSLEYRAQNDEIWAERYKSMALDELKHSDILHSKVTEEIDKLRKHFIPSQEMMMKWNQVHQEYMEKYDDVKTKVDF